MDSWRDWTSRMDGGGEPSTEQHGPSVVDSVDSEGPAHPETEDDVWLTYRSSQETPGASRSASPSLCEERIEQGPSTPRGLKRKRGLEEPLPSPSLKLPNVGLSESDGVAIPKVLDASPAVMSSRAKLMKEMRNLVSGKLTSQEVTPEDRKYIALDCEMVGLGPLGGKSSLARVSIVNYHGAILLDTFVGQTQHVVDYRTKWSGVRPKDLVNAPAFEDVQRQVAALMKDRILIGHALINDFRVLKLSHPPQFTRDTQFYKPLRDLAQSRTLKVLIHTELGIDIQFREHNSVVDARAALALFRLHKEEWDRSLPPSHHIVPLRTEADKEIQVPGPTNQDTASHVAERPSLQRKGTSTSTEGDSQDLHMRDEDHSLFLSGLTLHFIPAKLEPAHLAHLVSLAESHGASLSSSLAKADIVLTAVSARKRLERHMDWEQGTRRWVLKIAWLADSVVNEGKMPYEAYIAIPGLQPPSVTPVSTVLGTPRLGPVLALGR